MPQAIRRAAGGSHNRARVYKLDDDDDVVPPEAAARRPDTRAAAAEPDDDAAWVRASCVLHALAAPVLSGRAA